MIGLLSLSDNLVPVVIISPVLVKVGFTDWIPEAANPNPRLRDGMTQFLQGFSLL